MITRLPAHADDDNTVLRRLGRSPATTGELRDDLGARLSGERVQRAVGRLRKALFITTENGVHRLTDAGRGRLAELSTREKVALPVLPEPLLPHAQVDCHRRRIVLTAGQCAGSWANRGGDVCARGADGVEVKGGCPTGAEAHRRLKELERGREERKRQGQKERRAVA